MRFLGRKKEKDLLQEYNPPLPRMALKPPLAVQQLSTSKSNPTFFGYAINLTREGIFVPTMNPKPVGFRVHVKFTLPKINLSVEGEIEVVWRREFDPKRTDQPVGMGLRFVNLGEEKKSAIDRFIAESAIRS